MLACERVTFVARRAARLVCRSSPTSPLVMDEMRPDAPMHTATVTLFEAEQEPPILFPVGFEQGTGRGK